MMAQINSDPKNRASVQKNITIMSGILCALITWLFGLRPFVVKGISMYPTFNESYVSEEPSLIGGDYLIIDIFSYMFLRDPDRFDVVVFKNPANQKQHLIKRIIGLPHERIHLSGNKVTIIKPDGTEMILDEYYINQDEITVYDEQTVQIAGNQYFLLGDNRINSYDSRVWHGLDKKNIVGQVLLRLYPFRDMGIHPGGVNN